MKSKQIATIENNRLFAFFSNKAKVAITTNVMEGLDYSMVMLR